MNTHISSGFRLPALLLLGIQILWSQPQIPAAATALADWGISSPAEVRFGVLNVIHDPGGDRLTVNTLLTESPARLSLAASSATTRAPSARARIRPTPPSRATWVWNTDSLLANPGERARMLSTIESGHFSEVYLQVPRSFLDDSARDTELRDLVRNLTTRGASVYALSGDPEFTLLRNYSVVERTIHRVISCNRTATADSRFAGFHLDAEPYLLPGFGGPRRNWILNQYLTVTERAARLCHSNDLRFGTDIPFWFNLPDEFTGAVDSIAYNGTTKLVNEFVTDWADEICVMSYRTAALGTNGIVSVSLGELAYAEEQGKTVFVGLETGDVPDEDHYYFGGTPATDTTMLGMSERVVVMGVSGDSAEVCLVSRPEACALARSRDAAGDSARALFFWEVVNSSHISSLNLSFVNLGKKELERTISTVIRQLSGYSSFGGVAIHHAGSFAELPE
ncbi:MAG TPA: hypothetical protein VMM37_10185 [Bacteroidota bacterium]|nr:hypothetical protein [Bacteroidota bacterium]